MCTEFTASPLVHGMFYESVWDSVFVVCLIPICLGYIGSLSGSSCICYSCWQGVYGFLVTDVIFFLLAWMHVIDFEHVCCLDQDCFRLAERNLGLDVVCVLFMRGRC